MSALSIQSTFPIFTDIDGQPLDNGYVWIGVRNLDPQTNPVNVFWDAALTVAAPRPIRTIGGYPSRNGAPGRLYVGADDYSVRVTNKNGTFVYGAPEASERLPFSLISGNLGSDRVRFQPAGAGAVATTVQDKLREVVSVKDFGAVGDGVTDDTAAIQAAFDAVPNGGVVYFPKTGGGVYTPSYYISSGLTLSKNDVTIYSDFVAAYSEGIKTDQAITILTVTGFGLRLQNMTFRGNTNSSSVFATTKAVVIDRRSLGLNETFSNLDAHITNCAFFRLGVGVEGYGRNVFIFDSIFSDCKNAVIGRLFDHVNFPNSQFRGWRISRNRFHGCGYPYHPASGGTVTVPTSIAALDSWCIEMPQTGAQTSHLEIFDNNCDFNGAGFYKGYTSGAKIKGNFWNQCIAIFVYADLQDTANAAINDSTFGVVENNTLINRRVTTTSTRGFWLCLNSFLITNVRNFAIQGNIIQNTVHQAVIADNCRRLHFAGNRVFNANTLGLGDSVARPGIEIINTSNATVVGNSLIHQGGNLYSDAFTTTNVSNIKFRDNTVEGAVNRYNVAASSLATAADDGLPWQTPTMQNGYTLGALSQGFRRLFNGTVLVDVQLTGGADNVVAFVLPVGYRPAVSKGYPAVAVWNTDTNTEGYAFVSSGGNVQVDWRGAASVAGYHLRCAFEAA